MFSITECPICGNQSFTHRLNCTDHTVSHETFSIVSCNVCSFYLTNPRPNDSELGRYYLSENYISHSKKSNSLVDIIYRISRVFTLSWKLKLVRKYLPDNNISLLDYGCGTGDFLHHAKTKGLNVDGIEPSDIARKITEDKIGQSIAPNLSEIKSKYAAITLWHVLEHVPDLNEKLRALSQLLTESGIIFIAVPNHNSPDAKQFTNSWAGYDVPRHLWHFSQKNMKELLNKHQLNLLAVLPMKLDAYYVSILSNKYQRKAGLYGFVSGLLIGLVSNLKARVNNNYSSLIYIASK